jgi:hypothetical protein
MVTAVVSEDVLPSATANEKASSNTPFIVTVGQYSQPR